LLPGFRIVRDFAADGGGKAEVEHLQHRLQCRVEADEAVRLHAKQAQVERQRDQVDQHQDDRVGHPRHHVPRKAHARYSLKSSAR
jgi:hypothetical protein